MGEPELACNGAANEREARRSARVKLGGGGSRGVHHPDVPRCLELRITPSAAGRGGSPSSWARPRGPPAPCSQTAAPTPPRQHPRAAPPPLIPSDRNSSWSRRCRKEEGCLCRGEQRWRATEARPSLTCHPKRTRCHLAFTDQHWTKPRHCTATHPPYVSNHGANMVLPTKTLEWFL